MFQTFPSDTAVRGLHTQYLYRDTKCPLLCFKGQQQILASLSDTKLFHVLVVKVTVQINYKNRLKIIICSGNK